MVNTEKPKEGSYEEFQQALEKAAQKEKANKEKNNEYGRRVA